jgi:hypothetical protein
MLFMGPMQLSSRSVARHRRIGLLALGAAVTLGLAGRLAVHAGAALPHGYAVGALGHATIALGAPWLAVAWAIGAAAASRRWGAVLGAGTLALGTGGWYLLSVVAGGHAALYYAAPMTIGWGLVALAAGALFGLAGSAWRVGGPVARAVAIAVLAGALAGEALLLMSEWTGRAAGAVLATELAAAVIIVVLARKRVPVALTLGLFVVAAVAFAQAEATVRDALRLVGWGGP